MTKLGQNRAAAQTRSQGHLQIATSLLVCAFFPCASFAGEITWAGGVTAIQQVADDDQVDPEFTVSADLFITIPGSTGEWLIYLEASSSPGANVISALYPTANADAGSVLNKDGDGGLQISELNYTFQIDGDRTLMIGLINPSAWLDRSSIVNDENRQYLNGSFTNNATIEFPDYTLGGVFRWSGSESRPEVSLVVASSVGKADVPDRSYQDLLEISSDGRGAFVGLGIRWLHEKTSLRLGTWLRSDEHVVTGRPDETDMNYGVYGVLDWHSGPNAMNFRLGLANEDVSVATGFAAIAYQRQTRLGRFGIGVAKTAIANSFGQSDLDDTLAAEMFFRIPVFAGSGNITPSIQYVENPGFDTSGSASGSSALVAGIRFHWAF